MLSLKLGMRDQEVRWLDWNTLVALRSGKFGLHLTLQKGLQDSGEWKCLDREVHCPLAGQGRPGAFIPRHGQGWGSSHCCACLVEEFRSHPANAQRVADDGYAFSLLCSKGQIPLQRRRQRFSRAPILAWPRELQPRPWHDSTSPPSCSQQQLEDPPRRDRSSQTSDPTRTNHRRF